MRFANQTDPTMTNDNTAENVSRRKVLKTGIATAVVGSGSLAGCAGSDEDDGPTTLKPSTPTDTPTPTPIEGLADDVTGWNFYPSDPALWTQSSEPFDYTEDGARWLAEPTEDRSIRCRIEEDVPTANAGFYLDAGPIGELDAVNIDAETVESAGDDAMLAVALYFDVDKDGNYFAWESHEGPMERFVDLGGDVEGLAFGIEAGSDITIDDSVEFLHVPTLVEEDFYSATFGDYVHGLIPGVAPDTNVAVNVGVLAGDDGTTEEVVIKNVTFESRAAPTLNDTVEFGGYYEIYPDDPSLYGRSNTAIDRMEGDSRWVSEPTDDGAMRLRVENDGGVSGFSLFTGTLGDLESYTIEAETLETDRAEEGLLWVGTYMDVDMNGDFFEWSDDDGIEAFLGFGADTECLGHAPIDPGGVTIDRTMSWGTIILPADRAPENATEKGWIVDEDGAGFAMYIFEDPADGPTLSDYLEGEVTVGDDIVETGTDPQTPVAIPVTLRGSGEGTVEECTVERVNIQ